MRQDVKRAVHPRRPSLSGLKESSSKKNELRFFNRNEQGWCLVKLLQQNVVQPDIWFNIMAFTFSQG